MRYQNLLKNLFRRNSIFTKIWYLYNYFPYQRKSFPNFL